MSEQNFEFLNLKKWIEEDISALSRLYCETREQPLGGALSYALLGEGKRVRPLLCLLASGVKSESDSHLGITRKVALALEMIHTYSLIHDDLPCMDNDALRRGRPTTHVKYNEWTALLVGDALLTDAFSIISTEALKGSSAVSSLRTLGILEILSKAAGSAGMIHGQSLDMSRTGSGVMHSPNEKTLLIEKIHTQKTGCLLAASLAAGYLLNPVCEHALSEEVYRLGLTLGLAFQIQDDLLDGSAATGKSTGKDAQQEKLCYPSVFGESESTRMMNKCFDEIRDEIPRYFPEPEPLLHFIARLRLREF